MATPKLRFKEFEGDWSTNKIEEISIVTSGGTPSRNVSDYSNGDIPWVTTSLVDFNVINEAGEFITQVGLDNSSAKLFPKDTILMAMYGQGITRGKVAILGIDATTNQACAAIKLKNGFETKFIFQNLMNRYEEIRDLSNEGGQKNLSAGIIKEILISFPEKEEQTKIASFLSAVDEKISQLTQKHALLSQYKQGMMQKLFSQQISFKADDGSEFGEWEETTIGKITSTISTGATPSTLKEEYWNGNIKWMSSGELNHRHVHDVEKTITELGFKSSSTKILPKHCVLIGLAGQGKTRGTVAINYIELSTNQSIAAIHPNPKVFDYRFIFFNLDMRYQELRALSTGDGGRGGLNLQIIKGVEIHLPCLEEQTKIANFLSSIDQKIEVVAQQIEQAKQWKKGLLQQMFV